LVRQQHRWLAGTVTFSEPDWPVIARYDADHLRRLALPIGGIGTGTISLAGAGGLRDVEIANRPAKGFRPDVATFVVRVAPLDGPDSGDRTPRVKALEGPIDTALYEGAHGSPAPDHGLPRFRHAAFAASYPFGRVELTDPDFPLAASLEGWNPFVPTDADASGIPVAVFTATLTNSGSTTLQVSLAASLRNVIGAMRLHPEAAPHRNHNRVRRDDRLTGVELLGGGDPDGEDHGSISLAVLDGEDVSTRTSWGPDRWGSGKLDFFDDLLADGALEDRTGQPDAPIASVCERRTLEPGQSTSISILMTWRFPNRMSWTGVGTRARVGNYYATRWSDAWAVAADVAVRLPELRARTLAFTRALTAADLPAEVVEAALANLSTLRTQTCFRTEDGRFFAWEGCSDEVGCCHGSCSHVWNYEQATPFLFGSLSRSMRESELAAATTDDGLMSFRVGLPLADAAQEWEHAAADGQMGCLVKLYRDWRLSGDDAMLRALWPKAKAALAFCWVPGGWDGDADGVMEGVQHNTMDVEYHGPNPQMQGWYLAALKAAEPMARFVGDDEFADRCAQLFDYGSAWMDAHLFNGEYYEHHIVPATTVARGLLLDGVADRPGQPSMQLGAGCLIDQLVGQYLAHVAGLGHLHDPAHVASTLASVVRYNRRRGFNDHLNVMRSYVLGDETAVLMASYPRGNRPTEPFSYFTEVMTGFEYTLAAGLAYEGAEDEACAIVRDVRARYDGCKRNPFDEAECGHHYARAMASWAMVLACSGFDYDGRAGTLVFGSDRARRRHVFSTGDAWGTCEVTADAAGSATARLAVHEGELRVRRLTVAGIGVGVVGESGDQPAILTAGSSTTVTLTEPTSA
jgi:uncharacterized protein (DUF608 family)